MNQEEERLAKLGLVYKFHADRIAKAADTIEQGVASLQRSAQAMNTQGSNLTSAVVNGVKGQVGGEIKHAVERELVPGHKMVMEDAQAIRQERQALAAEREAFKREIRGLLKISMFGLLICAVLAFVGIGAWGMYWAKKAKTAKAEAQWIERGNRADLVPCGDGMCANVDMNAEPVGDQKQYRPVKPRP